MTEQETRNHPKPWRVEYWRRCEEWSPKSCPRIVDANGHVVAEMPLNVGHPGAYDEQSDAAANQIVEAVNGSQAIMWTSQKPTKAGAYYVRRKGSKIRPCVVELDGDLSDAHWDDDREFAGPLPMAPE